MPFLFPRKCGIMRKLAPVSEIFLAQICLFAHIFAKNFTFGKLSWTIRICIRENLVHKYLSFLYISASESHEIFYVHAIHCNENPDNVIVRPQSQFSHSCVYERFIYSQDRSTYFHAAKYLFWIFGIVSSQCTQWMPLERT